jgi:hypothetical protein
MQAQRRPTHPAKNARARCCRVPRSEGSGSICTLPPARPTHASDNVAVDREIVRGSVITAPPPCPFRTWNGFPPSSIHVLVARTSGNRSSCVDGRRRVTVFERGGEPELQPPNLLLPRTQISVLLVADQPKSRHTNANPSPSAGPGALTETTPPATRNQSAA